MATPVIVTFHNWKNYVLELAWLKAFFNITGEAKLYLISSYQFVILNQRSIYQINTKILKVRNALADFRLYITFKNIILVLGYYRKRTAHITIFSNNTSVRNDNVHFIHIFVVGPRFPAMFKIILYINSHVRSILLKSLDAQRPIWTCTCCWNINKVLCWKFDLREQYLTKVNAKVPRVRPIRTKLAS